MGDLPMTPLERFDLACERMAKFKDQHGPFLILYLGLREALDAATEEVKEMVKAGELEPYDGRWGRVALGTRKVREVNLALLEATIPNGVYEDVVETKVNLKKLDDAVARGEADREKVEAATSTVEVPYASAKLSV